MLDWNSIYAVLAPELLLVAVGLAGVLIGAVFGDRANALSFRIGALALVAAAALAALNYDGGEAFDGLVRSNSFVNFGKIVSYGLAGAALFMAEGFLKQHDLMRYEYSLLVIFASLGMGVTLSAADLMTLYIGVEVLSLSSYVLAAFHRESARSSEAGLKYFVLGSLASGMLLYGASLVYGFTGETRFTEIANADPSIGYLFGMVLMITGLGFKISASPMHVWTPDVYEGAPSSVVAFFAAATKVATVVIFANVLFTAFETSFDDWAPVVAIIAGVSMLVGAFGGLAQTNIKRLLAYSSIANVGYALVAVAAGREFGAAALLLFMTLYAVASLGLFAGVMSMRRRGGMVEDIQELSGLIRTQTGVGLALTVLILSISGFPLFVAGFWGKVALFQAGLDADLLPLVIILVLSSVIAFGYYLRLLLIIWVNEPSDKFESVESGVTMIVAGSALATLALFVFIAPFQELTVRAASGFLP